ncbi:MAG: hypothetical protein AB8F95_01250 [Bacteroidia bacterium]
MEEFVVFRKFQNKEDAIDFSKRLVQLEIPHEIEDQSQWLDSAFGGGESTQEFQVKINPDDFDRVHILMQAEAAELIDKIPEDYYLYGFTDDELRDIVQNDLEWSDFDVVFAKKLLEDRGLHIDYEQIEADKKARFDDMARTEAVSDMRIYRGYILSVLGGIGGLIIGWDLWKSTKVIPDGRKVYTHNKSARDHGKRMIIFGLIVVPVLFFYYLFMGHG